MNKQDLVRIVANDAELSQRDASVLLDSALEAIMNAVAAGEKVQLMGFGSFEAKERAARVGRNPHTGETVEIPATTTPFFTPGTIFKEKVER